MYKGLESRASAALKPQSFGLMVYMIRVYVLCCAALLTRVFPFDVGQVGRAGVADGQTLLGHTLIPIHVHQVGRHRDLRTQQTFMDTL